MAVDYTSLSKACNKWLRETVKLIVADMYAKGVRHSSKSTSREAAFLLVRSAMRKKFGVPERLAITFPRHIVFVKYGVGKHRAKGSGKETPKDIVDNILEQRLPLLADVAADAYVDVVANNLFIDKGSARAQKFR